MKNDIGSYVEYNVDLNNDNDYTNDWKLFYAGNESGKNRLFLIAADYVPTDDENLKESMLFLNYLCIKRVQIKKKIM